MNGSEIEMARLLISRLGLTPEQLLNAPHDMPRQRETVPRLGDYVDRVANAVPESTRRAYETYWHRASAAWGDRNIDEITPLQITELAEKTKVQAIARKNSRDGRSAAEHMIGALRCLYRHAVADGLIPQIDNPALKVDKPRRLPSTRRALTAARLAEINAAAAVTGNDPDLDTLLLRLHGETACRRGGALGLRVSDLDEEQGLIRLREKGETVRWQPVSPTLMRHLVAHGQTRGTARGGTLLRYRNGCPITSRRYDHLWLRLGRHLPWVAKQQVTTHWLRHTTLTWVERNFGYAVARGYAGHVGKSDAGSTFTYVRAGIEEIALALSTLSGEPHPLAPTTNTDEQPQRLRDVPKARGPADLAI